MVDDPRDDEKLDRIFAHLRGPANERADTAKDAKLAAAWPGVVERARAGAERRSRASRRRWLAIAALAVAAALVIAFGVARHHPKELHVPDGPSVGFDPIGSGARSR